MNQECPVCGNPTNLHHKKRNCAETQEVVFSRLYIDNVQSDESIHNGRNGDIALLKNALDAAAVKLGEVKDKSALIKDLASRLAKQIVPIARCYDRMKRGEPTFYSNDVMYELTHLKEIMSKFPF